MSASGTWKQSLMGLGLSIYLTILGLSIAGVVSEWWLFAYAPAIVLWLLGALMPLRREGTLTVKPPLAVNVPPPTPSPPGGFPGLQPFGPSPASFDPLQAMALMQALPAQAQQEAEAQEPPEPEGEPRTLVGLTGWRVLEVTSMRPLVLVGKAGGHVIGRYAEPAICDQGGKHEVPAWSCSDKAYGCGYYILESPPRQLESTYVLAKVSPAGRTILCEIGYRTHRYRLEELWLPPGIVMHVNIAEAEERFGVPIYVLERMLPDGDRAKEGSYHLHTPGDTDPSTDEEGAQARADEGAGA